MLDWRQALGLACFFVVVGVVYFFVQGEGRTIDRTGVTLLILTGISMGFGLAVLFRGSRDV